MREEMRSLAAMANLAERQFGVVSYRQLRELGLSNGHIHRASKATRLLRVHRSVYAVGHKRLSARGRCMAAVLAGGNGAVLSHHSAAWLWSLLPTCPAEPAITAPGRGHRRRGIRVHRVAALADTDCGSVEGIPVTALERTLLDLGQVATARQLAQAVDRAHRTDRLHLDALDRIIARRRRTIGAKRLNKVLKLYRKPVFDRARSELLFLDALEKEGIPRPAINVWVEKWEIDAYWEEERFAVEVDGWETHGSREAFEEDRLRREEMMLAGIECFPVSARRIEKEPRRVAQRVRILLSRRARSRNQT
jgi:predicted transcriptional regulator of viral defense system